MVAAPSRPAYTELGSQAGRSCGSVYLVPHGVHVRGSKGGAGLGRVWGSWGPSGVGCSGGQRDPTEAMISGQTPQSGPLAHLSQIRAVQPPKTTGPCPHP